MKIETDLYVVRVGKGYVAPRQGFEVLSVSGPELLSYPIGNAIFNDKEKADKWASKLGGIVYKVMLEEA